MKIKTKIGKIFAPVRMAGKARKHLNVSSEDTPYNGESYSLHRLHAHTITRAHSQHDLDWLQRLVEREQVLITCLRCPRGLHATTETMNLRVPPHVYVCVQVHVGAHPSARVEAKSEGVLLNTFAPPTQASSFDRPVDRVGYAPLQPESR